MEPVGAMSVTCPSCGEELPVTLTAAARPVNPVGGPVVLNVHPVIPEHDCPRPDPPAREPLPEAI